MQFKNLAKKLEFKKLQHFFKTYNVAGIREMFNFTKFSKVRKACNYILQNIKKAKEEADGNVAIREKERKENQQEKG